MILKAIRHRCDMIKRLILELPSGQWRGLFEHLGYPPYILTRGDDDMVSFYTDVSGTHRLARPPMPISSGTSRSAMENASVYLIQEACCSQYMQEEPYISEQAFGIDTSAMCLSLDAASNHVHSYRSSNFWLVGLDHFHEALRCFPWTKDMPLAGGPRRLCRISTKVLDSVISQEQESNGSTSICRADVADRSVPITPTVGALCDGFSPTSYLRSVICSISKDRVGIKVHESDT
ncbi:uncharacterized protein MYCFIDRAFT_172707 [Pseudocercospora fijiensis CIRAD86]|uniref:Uncharacterized protein n=1 Tax=Pseudocercospora fijiensis (strain CIRAD86) TaxID=383855 RepID=M3BCY3_PSEFD|nr:uncharacterized protein MYCFIDRAFT_172707 [Pseudocercospora fijiensis CIRAD86]EME87028.1 hypothetical protein MYCFIDRAFT_172707 [Pseudocercospora fijiensis CIRAD86]